MTFSFACVPPTDSGSSLPDQPCRPALFETPRRSTPSGGSSEGRLSSTCRNLCQPSGGVDGEHSPPQHTVKVPTHRHPIPVCRDLLGVLRGGGRHGRAAWSSSKRPFSMRNPRPGGSSARLRAGGWALEAESPSLPFGCRGRL